MSYDKINPRIIESIQRYALHHVPTGGFLRAVLENDLLSAVNLAGDYLDELREIVMYIHWEIRGDCHGSPERVRAWLATGVQVAEKMLEHHLGEQADGTFKVAVDDSRDVDVMDARALIADYVAEKMR